MLNNLYDLVWEAELKNLATPDIIASVFRAEANPFGIPFKKKVSREISVGDLIQFGPTHYLAIRAGLGKSKSDSGRPYQEGSVQRSTFWKKRTRTCNSLFTAPLNALDTILNDPLTRLS